MAPTIAHLFGRGVEVPDAQLRGIGETDMFDNAPHDAKCLGPLLKLGIYDEAFLSGLEILGDRLVGKELFLAGESAEALKHRRGLTWKLPTHGLTTSNEGRPSRKPSVVPDSRSALKLSLTP